MQRPWRLLDQILRGEATRPSELQAGRLTFPVGGLSGVGVALAMAYGLCMGCYSIFRSIDASQLPSDYRQLLASTLKTPALFFLTLVITFPSLYVFNALVGSRLSFMSVLKLLIAALAVNLAVLASLGPIVAFFSLSTNSYGFMILLNVAVFTISGVLGLAFLIQTLNRLQRTQEAGEQTATVAATTPPTELSDPEVLQTPLAVDPPKPTRPGALDRLEANGFQRQVRVVFGIWIVVFSLVGAQMGWVLRPFIGHPSVPFQWLRPRQSNFFAAVSTTFFNTLTGSGRTDADPNAPRSPTLERPARR